MTTTGREARLVVSRFVIVSWSGGEVEVLSPVTRACLRSDDPRLVRLLDRCATPQPVGRLARNPDTRRLVEALVEAAILVPEGGEQARDPALRFWEAHDLAFHARARLTPRRFYRFFGQLPDEPRFREPGPGPMVPLAASPTARRRDRSYFEVLARRQSCRSFADRPVPLEALGRLLNGAAENLGCLPDPEYDTVVCTRPYPTSGGRAALEIYVVVGEGRCEGLAAGLYHYRPADRALQFVTKPGRRGRKLLRVAALSALVEGQGWVLLCFTARLARVTWKYENTAYANVLKEVGCLMQTVYMAAGALGLGCCAVGNGPFDALPELAGTDWLIEAPVGEMVVGVPGAQGMSPQTAVPAKRSRKRSSPQIR